MQILRNAYSRVPSRACPSKAAWSGSERPAPARECRHACTKSACNTCPSVSRLQCHRFSLADLQVKIGMPARESAFLKGLISLHHAVRPCPFHVRPSDGALNSCFTAGRSACARGKRRLPASFPPLSYRKMLQGINMPAPPAHAKSAGLIGVFCASYVSYACRFSVYRRQRRRNQSSPTPQNAGEACQHRNSLAYRQLPKTPGWETRRGGSWHRSCFPTAFVCGRMCPTVHAADNHWEP